MSQWPYNTRQWQRLRRAKLDQWPLCEGCYLTGTTRPATEVDHRDPISAGGDPFPPLSGLSALCHSCHNAKTAAETRGNANVTGRKLQGTAPDGSPVCPDDLWNKSDNSAPATPDRPNIVSFQYLEGPEGGSKDGADLPSGAARGHSVDFFSQKQRTKAVR